MVDVDQVKTWVEGYLQAWNSNDPQAIGQLFSEEAAYYTGPFDEPWKGRATIVANWLERKDEPGTFRFHYLVLSASDDLGVVRGWTLYLEAQREFANLWLIKFDPEGRCSEFTEWWVQRK